MNQNLIHVYLMPGMAANPSIFEYIKLPEQQFKIHWLEWVIPEENESLKVYAKRMSLKVKVDHSVLIGVSFGGVLVQEMSHFLNLKKLIIVSSIKCNKELPARLHLLRKSKAYKYLPTQLLSHIDLLAKYTVGNTLNKRMALYKKYLSVNDKRYLDWAIKEIVCWEQSQPLENCIHIHGDNDAVFPVNKISNYIAIKGGTHIMIINKYKWFNENLPKLILTDK